MTPRTTSNRCGREDLTTRTLRSYLHTALGCATAQDAAAELNHAAPAHEARRVTHHSNKQNKNKPEPARPRRAVRPRVRRERSAPTNPGRLAPVQRRDGRGHAAHAG